MRLHENGQEAGPKGWQRNGVLTKTSLFEKAIMKPNVAYDF